MEPSHSPLQNHILAALPVDEFERLLPNLEWVPMRLGQVLYESGVQMGIEPVALNLILSMLICVNGETIS